METVEVAFSGDKGYRATEVVADLRNASETLFYPMKMVGYWDGASRDHLCPQSRLSLPCPHVLPPDDPGFSDYVIAVERDVDAVLDVYFPHADVHLYLS